MKKQYSMRVMIDAEAPEHEYWEPIEVEANSEAEAYKKAREAWCRMYMNVLSEEDYFNNFSDEEEED